MFGNKTQTPGGNSSTQPAHPAFATTVGAVAVFFASPQIERASEPTIRDYAASQWGDWTGALIGPLWWLACIAAVFFGMRAATPRALKMFELKIWRRLFP